MKTNLLLETGIVALAIVFAATTPSVAQTKGNGINTNPGTCYNTDAPDADGDGIPNGQDPDYVKYSKDGTGYQRQMQCGNGSGTMDQTRLRTHSRLRLRLKLSDCLMGQFGTNR